MLTFAVQLASKAEVQNIRNDLSQRWEFFPGDWDDQTKINVPNLTVKERLLIEGMLFSMSDEEVHQRLPFRFNTDEKISLAILKEYARHYRRYPSYFQVVI
jgi:hypothetical protein